MKILVACEESQRVTIAFRSLGHDAFSCDILDCSGGHPDWHIKQDVLPLLNGNCIFETDDGVIHTIKGKWDMIIAFPPCTYLSCAGAVNLFNKDHTIKNFDRLQRGYQAADFFMSIYNANCSKIAIENPRPISLFNLPGCSQIIQPFMFGEPFSKRTYLWLKGLPLLNPTKLILNYEKTITARWFQSSSGSVRQRNRSKTFNGVAAAMAARWSSHFNAYDCLHCATQLSVFDLI